MDTYITSIGFSVPKYSYNQMDLSDWMYTQLNIDDDRWKRKLKVLYQKTLINNRYSVLKDFRNHSEGKLFNTSSKKKVEDRMEIYKKEAPSLALDSINECLEKRGIGKKDVTHLISVSCTGMSAPGIEQIIKNEFGFDEDIETYGVNFIGCYAVFPALKMADAICFKNPEAKVMVVAVELCTIHFQNKTEDDFILSNSLFADGSAAALVEGNTDSGKIKLKLKDFVSTQFWEGKQEMAWDINSEGFLMKLTSYVPDLVKNGITNIIQKLIKKSSLKLDSINYWAIHPGGRKILESCESELDLSKDDLSNSYEVLRDYGNMSAPTILFVLSKFLYSDKVKKGEQIFACGFGPGLTLDSALLEFH